MIIAGIDPSINGTGVFKFFLDDKLQVQKVSHLGFTQVKKYSCESIIHYKKTNFYNYIEQNKFMYDHLSSFLDDVSYVAMEDYAFAATGRVYHIGEFVGGLKILLYDSGKMLRMYEPTVLKKFATGKGNSDKVSMCDAYNTIAAASSGLLDLPSLKEYASPKTDLVDAYYATKLLNLELLLRYGFVSLNNLSQTDISIFNRCTKSNPVNILARDFLNK